MTIDSAAFDPPGPGSPVGFSTQHATVVARNTAGTKSAPVDVLFTFPVPLPPPPPPPPLVQLKPGPVVITRKLTVWPSSKGDIVLTTPGDVVEGYDVHARIIRKAPGCGATDTIVRGLDTGIGFNSSLIDCTGNYWHEGDKPFTATNVIGVPTVPSVWWQGVIGGHHYVVRTMEGYWLIDGHAIFNTHGPETAVDIELLYVHDHAWYAKDPNHGNGPVHGDGGEPQGGHGYRLVNSLLTGLNDRKKFPGAPYGINSALQVAQNVQQVTGMDVHDNMLGGGGFATVNLANAGKPADYGSLYGNTFLPTVNLDKTKGFGYQISHHPGDKIDLVGPGPSPRPNLMLDGSPVKIYVGT